jgi:CheY-specific phosphatase CheX
MLAAAAEEVLATMFFTDIYGPAQPHASGACRRLAARLRFEGTPSGVFALSVSVPAVRTLAANFLARDDEEALPDAQLESVVCELANMICGSLLSQVKTEERFRLSSPEVLRGDDALPATRPNQSLSLGEDSDTASIDFWLALESHVQ